MGAAEPAPSMQQHHFFAVLCPLDQGRDQASNEHHQLPFDAGVVSGQGMPAVSEGIIITSREQRNQTSFQEVKCGLPYFQCG